MTMHYRLNSNESIESSIMAAKRDGFLEGVSAEGMARWIQNVNRSHAAARAGARHERDMKRIRNSVRKASEERYWP
jgi:hypothetical protein